MQKIVCCIILSCFIIKSNAKQTLDSTITNKKRQYLCYSVGLGGTAIAHIALSQIWYKDYPKSHFHFYNDNRDWLQMDKMGHAFSSYYLGIAGIEAAKWSGVPKNKQWKWALFGSIFQTPIEIWDGFSAGWGASWGDLIANSTGTILSAGQQALWNEQKIKYKFSFYPSSFAKIRPSILGSSWNEQLLKDYNAQTYWLSYAPVKKTPWLAVSLGYSVNGLLGGTDNYWEDQNKTIYDYTSVPRQREYLLSLDINWSAIKTKKEWLKKVFFVLNAIKIPFPALHYQGGRLSGSALYF